MSEHQLDARRPGQSLISLSISRGFGDRLSARRKLVRPVAQSEDREVLAFPRNVRTMTRPLSPHAHTRPSRARTGLDRRVDIVEIRSRNCKEIPGRRRGPRIATGLAVHDIYSWKNLARSYNLFRSFVRLREVCLVSLLLLSIRC